LQVSLSIADQEAIDLVLPAAIEHDIGVIAKRPIANAAWLAGPFVQSYVRPYQQRLRKLRFDFLKHSANESVSKRAAIYAQHCRRSCGNRGNVEARAMGAKRRTSRQGTALAGPSTMLYARAGMK